MDKLELVKFLIILLFAQPGLIILSCYLWYEFFEGYYDINNYIKYTIFVASAIIYFVLILTLTKNL